MKMKNKKLPLFLVFTLCLSLITMPDAVDISFSQDEFQDFEEISLYIAQPKTVPVSNPTRVAVTKPDIADVQSVAVNEIMLEPKAAGVTTFFVWDDYGRHAYQLKVFSEDLSEVKQHADSLIRELKIDKITTRVNELERKIILLGEVENISEKERLLTALGSIKDKFLDLVTVREERALIQSDVQILEITRDNLKNLGIEYQTSVSLTDSASKGMNKIMDMFATSMWTRGKLDVIINTYVKEGKARILSKPKLVCLSGKEASFLVGGQVPVVTATVSSTGTTTNAEFKDYGINLKIKPYLKDDSDILINISTEVSELDPTNAVKTNVGTIPAFTTRNTQTELYLKDGQSVIIAGLIKNKDSDTVKKFPYLGDVPVLGLLWRSRDFQNNQTELVVLITPTIVRQPDASVRKPLAKKAHSIKMGERERQFGEREAAPVGAADSQAFGLYVADIRNQIIASLDYPGLAKESGSKSAVKVRLRILPSGQLRDILVLKSSGSGLLDASVIKAIKKIAPFSSFPGSLQRNEIAVDIPIIYN